MATKNTHDTSKHIIFTACEAEPYSKTGGLADVVGELSPELKKQGHHVLVVSPYYPKDHKYPKDKDGNVVPPEVIGAVAFPFDEGEEVVKIRKAEHDGVTYAFIDHPSFDQQRIGGYGDVDVRRNVLLSCAVPHIAAAIGNGFEQPDIVHAHDWHVGYLPVIMKHGKGLPEGFTDKAKTIFTIHNAGYCGISSMDDALRWTCLPPELKDSPIKYRGHASALTAGAGFADMVTTVSPTYGKELQSGQQQGNLALGELYPVKGVVNGLAADWDLKDGPHNRPTFSADDLIGKRQIKQELCGHFDLDASRPTIGIVSRIGKEQKGIDVLIDSIDDLAKQGWNIVVAGDGDEKLRNELLKKQNEHPGHVAYHNGWSGTKLTHLITAGSDAYIVPSVYEPCGLTQLQAMRSGTLPIVTDTGGLADTVKVKPGEPERGFVFPAPPTKEGIVAAAQDARALYNDKNAWHERVEHAMAYDSSWHHSAEEYEKLYTELTNQQPIAPDIQKSRANYHKTHGQSRTHLRCYNMYPRHYTGRDISALEAMRDDIPNIKEMGFNAIWINPLAEVGEVPQPDWTKYNPETKDVPEGDPTRTRSLYAMKNPYDINKEFVQDGTDPTQTIKELTKSARDKNMSVMCDVALSHVALEAPIVSDPDAENWFKRDKNGTPLKQGIDENGKVTAFNEDGSVNPKMVWADIAKFDYSDKQTRRDIIDQFWKPYMEHLVDLGFTGMRVDSVAQNDPEVMEEVLSYFKEQVVAKHGIPRDEVLILGETLGQSIEDYKKTTQLSHTYLDGAFWMPGVSHSVADAHDKDAHAFWKIQHENDDNWLTAGMKKLEKKILDHTSGTIRGSAIGYPGSHDEQPIVNDFLKDEHKETHTLNVQDFKELRGSKNPKILINLETGTITRPDGSEENIGTDILKNYIDTDKAERAMREKMAQTMLIPNGGYFLFSGDERMQAGYRSVFDDHQHGPDMADLRGFVKEINRICNELPPMEQGAWATRRLRGIRDDLIVIERHNKKGYEGTTDIILLSTEPDGQVKPLTTEDIHSIEKEVLLENRDKRGRVLSVGKHPLYFEVVDAFNGKASSHDAKIRIHKENRIELSPDIIKTEVPDHVIAATREMMKLPPTGEHSRVSPWR